MGFRKGRLQTNRGFEFCDGRLDFSRGVEDPAGGVVGFGAIRIQTNCGFELFASNRVITALQSSETFICGCGSASRSVRFVRSSPGLGKQRKRGEKKGQEREANLVPESNARTEHAARPPNKSFTSY